MEHLLTTPTSQLILAERKAQIAKWGKQHMAPADWLLILNEEMGELAQVMWEKKSIDLMIGEAVQVAAVAVQIAEWVSERVGWANDSEQALLKGIESKQLFSTWQSSTMYLKMINEVGGMAFSADHHSDQFWNILTEWSRYIRNLIYYSYMLIDELTAKKGREAAVAVEQAKLGEPEKDEDEWPQRNPEDAIWKAEADSEEAYLRKVEERGYM